MKLSRRWGHGDLMLLPFFLFPLSVSAGPSINVALQASFNAAPYLVELLETAASENSSCYFPLLDRIASGTFSELNTPESLYNSFLDVLVQDGHFQSDEALSSFKFALSIHSAAPRIEAHYQYYNSTVQPLMMVAQDAACPVWIHLDGHQYCSPALERAQQPVEFAGTEEILPFDRIDGASDLPPSVLYADITHPLFAEFHQAAIKNAKEGQASYRLRYRPSGHEAEPLFLNGYGVELALKRTDYIVIDDREASKSRAEEQQPPLGDKLEDDVPSDIKPLSKSEVLTLGLNASSFVMSSSDPFDTLIKLSQDFPKHSGSVAAHEASAEFLREFKSNRAEFLPAGYNIMWINGLQIDTRHINAFSLLDHMRKERSLMNSFREEGLSAAEAVKILSHSEIAQAQADNDVLRYDYRDEAEGGNVIMWLNDLERDKRYGQWPSSLQSFLQRVYPGQLPTVRRDLHNLLIPVDLTEEKELELIVATLQSFIQRTVPVRFAIIPALPDPESIVQAKISYYLLDAYGLSSMFEFFQQCLSSGKAGTGSKSAFKAAIKDKDLRRDHEALSFEDILTSESLEKRIEQVKAYNSRLALDGEYPPILVNGVALSRDENWLELMSNRVNLDLRLIQRQIVESLLPEDAWLPGVFLSQAVKRRNALVVPEDPTNIKNIALYNVFPDKAELSTLPHIQPSSEIPGSELVYLLVVANLNSKTGQSLLLDALEFKKSHPELDLVLLQNPESFEACSKFSVTAHKALTESASSVEDIILSLQQVEDESADPQECATVGDLSNRQILTALNLNAGDNGLLMNQRFIGPIQEGQFLGEDYDQLLFLEKKKHFTPLTTALKDLQLDTKIDGAFSIAKLNSLAALAFISDVPEGYYESPPMIRINQFTRWASQHSAIHVSTTEDPSLQIVAALDPTAEIGQQWLPILKALSELQGVDLKIYLNPRERLQELPIKRFYRQVIDSQPRFGSDGSLQQPKATFKGIPEAALLNLGMNVPPTWLVAPKSCIYDLDNIKLNSVAKGENIDAIYELEHILIEGHSRDTTTGQPPRGAQLFLGTESKPHYTDTLVMANLGYFQFKANPGYWKISLHPGRSSKIFKIDSLGSKGYRAEAGDEGTSVALLSFQGVTLYPRVSRKPGMEFEDVLESGPKAGSAMDYLSRGASFASSAFSSITKTSSGPEHADINIFSVASGHLYERMLNIMILSVLKNTKSTVKFWFIEQFLSPSFKEFLPHLAAHYNFSFEMVTYKWPHWLRGQKEKQREIWGYKILFLDVLFPLSLDKVIFVDADQVVRTDMLELTKVDLQGAPYGFTPMCNSRTEMEGFRFWNQGYWKQYLQGKPYHISALYVVDLKRFRELAAGDRLRQTYHSLSADPASLSNLDQDLPNHMQHQLPIHSLEQDWLWCETWCSDEAFKTAKTVDLCNNPLTKEPKLDRARRQVPEWTVYDDEIAAVARAVAEEAGDSAGVESSHLKDGVQAAMDEARKRDEL